jgi:hypothetical protein
MAAELEAVEGGGRLECGAVELGIGSISALPFDNVKEA